MDKLEKMQRQIDSLEAKLKSMSDATTIDFDTENAFRTRFRLDSVALLTLSGKSESSESQTVNEAGSAPTYNVLKQPDKFLEFSQDGITYYIPVYLS